MFRISAITRVGLVAAACVAVAAPSALAEPPVKGKATCLYWYGMSYTPTKATQKSLYGYAMSYTPTKANSEESLYGYAMSYTPTKATRTPAEPATQKPAIPSADPAVSENTDYEYDGKR
jgi:hypothetical protein